MDEFSIMVNGLKQGKLIAYPTETVWGVGCDAFCERAVKDLLMLKNRPMDKGLIVLSDSVERILPFLGNLPTDRQDEIIATWQNPVQTQATTWLFPIPNGVKIPTWLTGSHDSLAIRVISHSAVANLCANLVDNTNPYGFLVSTSCNPATLPPAVAYEEAWAYFGNYPNMLFLQEDTLGYQKPSRIRCAINGDVIRL